MRKQIFITILLILTYLFVIGCSNNNVTGSTVADSEGVVKIPLSDLSDKVQFYTFEDNGVKINYFAVLGSDGKPRTAFDACDVCGGYKGYEQRGDDIRCRNCGRAFSIDGLGTRNKGYGCWPSYIPHEVKDGDILVKISDLKTERAKFA